MTYSTQTNKQNKKKGKRGMPVTELLNTAINIFSKFHVKVKFLSKVVAHELLGHPVEHYQLLYNPERISALYSSYHLYSVVCVLLEPMSFPKFLIVAQSVLKSLNKLLKSKARMSPKNEIIISIFCISYYPT